MKNTRRKRAAAAAAEAGPRPVPALDRNLGVRNYRSAGDGRDGEMFSLTLTLDGKPFATVTQEGHGGPNHYDYRDEDERGTELEEWARGVTGSDFDALDLVVDHLLTVLDLNKQARKLARDGYEGTLLILAEPAYLDEGEEPNPFRTTFAKTHIMGLRKREEAAAVAAREGALFYAVSDELPPGSVADQESAEKAEALRQARKWNRKDPTIRAALLVRKTPDEQGTYYGVRTEDDVKRLIAEHGTAYYVLSDFLPEPTPEQVRASTVKRLNSHLAKLRKDDRRVFAVVSFQTAEGRKMTALSSREPARVLEAIRAKGATSDDYFISDPPKK